MTTDEIEQALDAERARHAALVAAAREFFVAEDAMRPFDQEWIGEEWVAAFDRVAESKDALRAALDGEPS